MKSRRTAAAALAAAITCGLAGSADASAARPEVSRFAASDTSPPLSELARGAGPSSSVFDGSEMVTRDPGAIPADDGHEPDGALQRDRGGAATAAATALDPPLHTFEGPGTADNFAQIGARVNPPDPAGDVGPNHYVAMTNLTFAVYTKTGTPLIPPTRLGALWADFPVADCGRNAGDPIVLHDQIADRWVLMQFTSAGTDGKFWLCFAVSSTADPTGAYFRYALPTGDRFPDYPKFGVWPDAYYATTREFGPSGESIGVYALDRRQLLAGKPDVQVVSFNYASPSHLVGDGILPADLDGKRLPPRESPAYFVGSMDSGYPFDGAPFDGLNVFQMRVHWRKPETSTFGLTHQLPVADMDTVFPCAPSARACVPQPGVAANQYLDVLSYRQRPIHRLAYRNFGSHESLVTNQSVEARPGIAGTRFWEIRRPRDPVLHQDGTYSPDDGVHRWMGSIAMDKRGNMALGYSVSNGTDVFPGIRVTGRLVDDPLSTMAQGEQVLQAGSGVQQTTNNRWGDYTSMNVDPSDDCTFYYINEYYATSGSVNWQTRVGAFRLPGCIEED